MGKEKYVSPISANIALALGKTGIKGTVTEGEITPWSKMVKRVTDNYAMGIENAHKKAGRSKLFFDISLIPKLRPSNS